MPEEFASNLRFSSAAFKTRFDGSSVFEDTAVVKSRQFSYVNDPKSKKSQGELAIGGLGKSDPDLVFTSKLDLSSADKLASLTFQIKGQSLPAGVAVSLSSPDSSVNIPKTTTTTSSGLFGATSAPIGAISDKEEIVVSLWLQDQIMQTGSTLTLLVNGEDKKDQSGLIGKTVWILAMPA